MQLRCLIRGDLTGAHGVQCDRVGEVPLREQDPARDDILPLLEIFTEGVLGSTDLLEEYLTNREGSLT